MRLQAGSRKYQLLKVFQARPTTIEAAGLEVGIDSSASLAMCWEMEQYGWLEAAGKRPRAFHLTPTGAVALVISEERKFETAKYKGTQPHGPSSTEGREVRPWLFRQAEVPDS